MDFKPKLASVAKDYEVTIYYLEVDLLKDTERDELKKHFNYRGTPTTIFITGLFFLMVVFISLITAPVLDVRTKTFLGYSGIGFL